MFAQIIRRKKQKKSSKIHILNTNRLEIIMVIIILKYIIYNIDFKTGHWYLYLPTLYLIIY